VCKNVSLAVLFGSKDNSFTICAQSDMCIYTVYIYIYIYIYIYTHTHTHTHTHIHVLHNIETLVGQKK